jgi:hypothetical protein
VKRFPRPAYGVLARCSDRVNDVPKSTLGQAVNYFLNDYDALVRYLKDGRFEIDNNRSRTTFALRQWVESAGSS